MRILCMDDLVYFLVIVVCALWIAFILRWVGRFLNRLADRSNTPPHAVSSWKPGK